MHPETPRPHTEKREKPSWLPKKRYLKFEGGWKPVGFISEDEYGRLGIDPKNYKLYDTTYQVVVLAEEFDDEYLGLAQKRSEAQQNMRVSFSENHTNLERYKNDDRELYERHKKLEALSLVSPHERTEFSELYDEKERLHAYLYGTNSDAYSKNQSEVRPLKVQLKEAIERALTAMQHHEES
jgi:hypothetical protein